MRSDFAIVCGLSQDGEPDDWLHLGIPVHADEIWELQFYCCHKSGDADAIVIGSFVMFDNQGTYIGTTPGPIENVTDSTAWTFYSYQYQFTALRYVFPAIWWHGIAGGGGGDMRSTGPAPADLEVRYLCAVQMAQIQSQGGVVAVLQPDIYLTLMPPGPGSKVLAGDKAHLGPL